MPNSLRETHCLIWPSSADAVETHTNKSKQDSKSGQAGKMLVVEAGARLYHTSHTSLQIS